MSEKEYDAWMESIWTASVATARFALEEGKLIARQSLKSDDPAVIAQIASSIVTVYAAKTVEGHLTMPTLEE
jgi:hypothetical protein